MRTGQESVVREIRMLRLIGQGLETGGRTPERRVRPLRFLYTYRASP